MLFSLLSKELWIEFNFFLWHFFTMVKFFGWFVGSMVVVVVVVVVVVAATLLEIQLRG